MTTRLRWWLADRLRPGVWPSTAAQHDVLLEQIRELTADRDRWIRLFNRLEATITHHQQAKALFADDADDALHAARVRVLRDAAASQPRED